MELKQLIKENPNLNLTVSAKDLMELAIEIAECSAKTILDNQEERLLTREEVIQQLGVSSATLWRWNRLGILKAKKIGAKVFYSEIDLKAKMKIDNAGRVKM